MNAPHALPPPGTVTAATAAFAANVLEGLAQPQKRISSAWLYDRRGSELFEEITHLPEYYPTRTEISLLEAHVDDMARPVGPGAVVVEIGSGSSRKTPLLLRALAAPHAYVPLDLAEEFLWESARTLAREFSGLRIAPLLADFTQPFALPDDLQAPERPRLGFFPGSTIGNLSPAGAIAFLRLMAGALGADALMLIGTDCTRDPAALLPAYDDTRGVTAAFNLNLLARINRELGADFALAGFRHEARYRADLGRIEMHLVSRRPQRVRLCGRHFDFAAGETIHTENSYKYSRDDFCALAHAAGWLAEGSWSDRQQRFCIHRLRLSPRARSYPRASLRSPMHPAGA
ncbi:hypothetical protein OTERR_14670 [Oryzomicrobium terrae]|uniref:Histidine-specific methyltransferase SAM-dependent domain-containing protein n=1 Tax=Oryzomicrobium terrae TaxID=1735038 RepID=A0A5C1E7U5_9RHOO|nr:L-histidine N(alpha)-methyltransferase [Oryzomicrobium terrae]QEL64943.1 hypothetical protein OTERR_14670 [Oryzomicrobium terrae]